MICAYDKIYLAEAQSKLAYMFEYVEYSMKIDLCEYYEYFLASSISTRFARGDVSVIAGKSGREMARLVLEENGIEREFTEPLIYLDRSAEYWTGWVLAYFQWRTSLSFEEINDFRKIDEIKSMYMPYHEMDIEAFYERMQEIYRDNNSETRLKTIRKNSGMSQRALADASGIPLKTIQQYEQRQKNINKANVDYLVALSRTLSCDIELLIEKI